MGRRNFGRSVAGEVFPLFDEFDGSLLYYPEIVPVALNFRRVLCGALRQFRQRLTRPAPRSAAQSLRVAANRLASGTTACPPMPS